MRLWYKHTSNESSLSRIYRKFCSNIVFLKINTQNMRLTWKTGQWCQLEVIKPSAFWGSSKANIQMQPEERITKMSGSTLQCFLFVWVFFACLVFLCFSVRDNAEPSTRKVVQSEHQNEIQPACVITELVCKSGRSESRHNLWSKLNWAISVTKIRVTKQLQVSHGRLLSEQFFFCSGWWTKGITRLKKHSSFGSVW